MVRQCAIPECKNNDQVTLCHRFPKRKEFMEKWRNSLALEGIDTSELLNRYVVCTQHFQATDYRNSASRMLNLTAVPTLNVFWKGEFYDPPKPVGKDGQMKISPEKAEPVPEATEIEVLEIERAEPEGKVIIETIEPVDEEFEVFYIEEEDKNTEEHLAPDSLPNVLEVIEECRIETPLSQPPAKRKYVQETPQSETSSPPKIILQDVAVQTDNDAESSEERRLLAEQYPEYTSLSGLEFARELKETTKQLAELKQKLAHFEAAHAVVREAFKSIMS